MANQEPSYYELVLRRGETRPIPLVYRPKDKSLAPYDLTGQTVEMRIKPKDQPEIVYTASPGIWLSNPAGGEITIDPSGAMVTAYQFQNASFVILLNGKRLIYGPLTVKSLYE